MSNIEDKSFSKLDDTITVYHRWLAVIDPAIKSIHFKVSKNYTLVEEEAQQIEPDDKEELFDLVMTLPFPDKNLIQVDGHLKSVADEPTYFDPKQLTKRYISVQEFTDQVTLLIEKIDRELVSENGLKQLKEEAEWDLL